MKRLLDCMIVPLKNGVGSAAVRPARGGTGGFTTGSRHPWFRRTRSEERRVRREWVSTCRTRCAPSHYKQNRRTPSSERTYQQQKLVIHSSSTTYANTHRYKTPHYV